jgi:hypothetical protein
MEIDETKWLGTQKESALPSGRALRTRTRRGKITAPVKPDA